MGGSAADPSQGSSVRARALALIGSEPVDTDTITLPPIDRICRAAISGLSITGAIVTLTSSTGAERIGISDEATAEVAELEFTIGEGPALDVARTHRPVLVPDLAEASLTTWPAYGRAATALGIAAVYAFPLHVGAVHFGTLSLYATEPGTLDGERMALALTFAEITTEHLLDGGRGPDGVPPRTELDAAIDAHSEVYQAQGMVMVELGIDLADALARLRAHAFALDRDLVDVARDVIAGRERIERDI